LFVGVRFLMFWCLKIYIVTLKLSLVMVSIEQVIFVVPLLALAASLFYNALNIRTSNKNQKMQLQTRHA
jgi:hypothetical protein